MAERGGRRPALAMLAGALALLAALAGEPRTVSTSETQAARRARLHVVPPLQLAHWIQKGGTGLRIVDLRDRAEFDEYHVPGAEHLTAWVAGRRRSEQGETIVLYASGDSTDDARIDRAWRALPDLAPSSTLVLEGGVLGWITDVESPRLAPLPATASPADSLARLDHLALSRWFGGTPVVDPALAATTDPAGGAAGAAQRQSSRAASAGAAVGAVRRRGC